MMRQLSRYFHDTPRLSINITFDVFNFNSPTNHDCGIMEIFVVPWFTAPRAHWEYKINFSPSGMYKYRLRLIKIWLFFGAQYSIRYDPKENDDSKVWKVSES